MYRDGRGENKKAMALKNMETVRDWFKKNPRSTIKECCDNIEMSYKTVRKHIDAIQKESVNVK